MTDGFDVGFLMGLLVGEGSFTGDRKKAAVQVKMNTVHRPLLQHMQRLGLLVLIDDYLGRIPDVKLRKRWRRLKKRYGLSQQFELLA